MTLKDFFQANGFTGKPDIRESQNCYADSDVNINYIRLPKEVNGFSFMIISENLLADTRTDKSALAKGDVVFDEEYGWHAQRPDSTKVSDLEFDW